MDNRFWCACTSLETRIRSSCSHGALHVAWCVTNKKILSASVNAHLLQEKYLSYSHHGALRRHMAHTSTCVGCNVYVHLLAYAQRMTLVSKSDKAYINALRVIGCTAHCVCVCACVSVCVKKQDRCHTRQCDTALWRCAIVIQRWQNKANDLPLSRVSRATQGAHIIISTHMNICAYVPKRM